MTAVQRLVLSRLRVTPLQIVLRITGQWNASRRPGILLRSALGYHLRQRECLTGASVCAGCPLPAECWYAFAFETPAPLVPSPRLQHADSHRPHPYFLASGVLPDLTLSPGTLLPCLLTVMGSPAPLMARLLGALDLAGRSGRWGGPFRLDSAVSPLQPQTRLASADLPDRIAAFDWPCWQTPEPTAVAALRLQTISPLRLRRQGQLIRQPSFADILQALSRRLHLLAQTFAQLELPPGWADGLLQDARQVETVRAEWRYDREIRFSSRQKLEIPLEGVSGALEVVGSLQSLWPFLHLAQWIGIGSSTAHGYGAVHVEISR